MHLAKVSSASRNKARLSRTVQADLSPAVRVPGSKPWRALLNRDHEEAFVEFQTFEEISSYVLRKNILFRLVDLDQVPSGSGYSSRGCSDIDLLKMLV